MTKAAVSRAGRKPTAGATRKPAARGRKPRSTAWINRVMILLAVSAVVAVSARGYMALNAIPVEHIVVSGKLRHTNTAALQEMIRPALVGGFLNADLQRVRASLESLPWVYRVSVRRRWPNALEVHVVEQLPIARWGNNGFLNHEGMVFRSMGESGEWANLPLLRGPEGTAAELMAIYQQMVEILSPRSLVVATLAIDERRQVEATLGNGTTLVLGGRDLIGRLRRFVELYQRGLIGQGQEIARVDLRYPNGLAVTYAEATRVAGL